MNTVLGIHFTENELHHLRRAFNDYADEKIRWKKELDSPHELLHQTSEEFSVIAQKLSQLLKEKTSMESHV